jgi:hypothetical protein
MCRLSVQACNGIALPLPLLIKASMKHIKLYASIQDAELAEGDCLAHLADALRIKHLDLPSALRERV